MTNSIARYPDLPANMPNVSTAKLPVVYESAKAALAKCSQIDECQDWADKAAALASYARQADDDTLERTAMRIRARAIKRCGELLKEIEPKHTGRPSKLGPAPDAITRKQAAENAGLSKRQQREAIRVANIPDEEFEDAIEADDPPTIEELAERGKKPAPFVFDLHGRRPEDFQRSTRAQGSIWDLAKVAREIPAKVAVRGALPGEHAKLKRDVVEVLNWCRLVLKELEEWREE